MKKIGVALLGLGVVGGGVYSILKDKREMIKKNEGLDIEVVKVLERNIARCDELGVDHSLIASGIDEIVQDENIQVVAEFFGGVEPAKSFLKLSLLHGKSVVTANKEMLAKSWSELEEVAQKTGAGIYFEASCVGGVPVIRTLTEAMQANSITSLKGIVNGTTNYILSRMSEEGLDYASCLKQAQELGYAEANPTADVDGFDATYKNSILSSLAYKVRVPIENIYREGISSLDIVDIDIAKSLGYAIKLLAVSSFADGKIEARVHPTLINSKHPLASVSGPFNALYIHGDNVDDIMLYGRGAGAFPTASAIVSDIVYAGLANSHRRFAFECENNAENVQFADDFECGYYVRFALENNQNTSKICDIFESSNVNIDNCIDKSVEGSAYAVVMTNKTKESVVKALIADVENKGLASAVALIRVEE